MNLAAHLQLTYGIVVDRMTPLAPQVLRVDRRDGPSWVARLFPPERPLDVVEGDAAVLRGLARAGFPAERCAHLAPVSTLEDQHVLVTEFVDGPPAPAGVRTYGILGSLLGRLHAHPVPGVRPGGAWHRLCPQGTPTDEIIAARRLLDEAGSGSELDRLRAEASRADGFADLPQAFIHPDFVAVNAIDTAGRLVIVDWTGAGTGPRVWSLGFLLWAAGCRGFPLVDAVVARYRRHIDLEADELVRLGGAIRARPLMVDCWSVGHGHQPASRAVAALARHAELADRIADRARMAFAAEP